MSTKSKDLDGQEKLIFDSKNDINPFWRSSLFSDVYLKNDVPREYKFIWNDDNEEFSEFCKSFISLCTDLAHESYNNWKEAETVKNWIVPVMDILGWENNSERRQNSYIDNESFSVEENNRKHTYRPDLLYFDKPKHKSYTQKEKSSDKKIMEAKDSRTGVKLVVEAKYWNRLTSLKSDLKKVKKGDSASGLGPELQTLKYMEIFDHDFGVLTDGKKWRLFHSELSQGTDRRSFDFDLGRLKNLALKLDEGDNRQKFYYYAKYFFFFFSKKSLVQTSESKSVPFVYEVFEYSKKYAHSIEDDLKERFILTIGVTCNALKKSSDIKDESVDLKLIRNVAESHLFNILFVKSCEVRGVLPINSTKYVRCSLHEVIETIDEMNFDPNKDWDDYLRDFRSTLGKRFDWHGFDLFKRFINLYEIIHDGTAKSKDYGFEVDGFKESIFSKEEWRFAKSHQINNGDMIKILHNLNFIESQFKNRKYQQIPYSYFSPRQLGGIYESFLEYQLVEAETDMIFVKKQWQKANLNSDKVEKMNLSDDLKVRKGELFFSPDNKERKVTGSYYTPDYIVRYMVEKTIGPVVKDLNSKSILDITICDPALGSGHFLAGALDYLVAVYRQKWTDENNDDLVEPYEETAKKVLHSCLYGVDLNPRAIKLAKLSFWLTTSRKGEKLEKLDDQIKNGDSLCGFNWKKEFKKVFNDGGFDIVIGNPPYLKEANNKELFRKYRESEVSSYFQGRMDLCYAFSCKSIDLLKEYGRHSFIMPSTWIKGAGASILRNKILKSTTLESYIDFNDYKVFEDASIQTMIYVLRKEIVDSSLIEYLKVPKEIKTSSKALEYINQRKELCILKPTDDGFNFISNKDGKDIEKILNNNIRYINKSEIGNGIDVLQDFVSKSHLKKLEGNFSVGDGVFVISNSEKKKIEKTKNDKSKIKPYYTTSELGRYKFDGLNSHWIIYADLEVRKNIEKYPGIKSHLDRFIPILTSAFKPYGLNRSRDEKLFTEKAIFSVRKTVEPSFSLVDSPCYVSRMFLIIQPKGWKESYEYINAVLNSSVIKKWLDIRGKKQGSQLQMDQGPISEIPIRLIDFSNELEASAHDKITKYVKEIYTLDVDSEEFKKINEKIDKLVTALYFSSKKNIAIIKELIAA